MKKLTYKFNGWESITLAQFIELTKGVDNLEGDELTFHLCSVLFDEPIELIKKAYPYGQVTTFAHRVMATLESIPEKSSLKSINDLKPPKMVSRLDGTWWSNATFEQVQAVMLEMERIQQAQEKLKQFDLSGFALMCAALFQKEGEKLTDELIFAREQMFIQMDMENIWQAFFLLKKWQKSTLRDLRLYLWVVQIWLKYQNLAEKLKGKFKRNKTE